MNLVQASLRRPLTVIVLITSIVNLFADMTYEGPRWSWVKNQMGNPR